MPPSGVAVGTVAGKHQSISSSGLRSRLTGLSRIDSGRAGRLLTAVGASGWLVVALVTPAAIDAHAYFVVGPPHLYLSSVGSLDAYNYSPAFWQLIQPLVALGWLPFLGLIRLADVLAIIWLAGPLSLPLLLFLPLVSEVQLGNVDLLLAVAIVSGFRYPGAWAFGLLTKVTPGVGLVWFAVRREWRPLVTALGTTAAIAVISFLLWPAAWFEWAGYLAHPAPLPPQAPFAVALPLPLVLRLPISIGIIAIGARMDRAWTLPVGVVLALPVVWFSSLAILVAALRLRRRAAERQPACDIH